MNKVVVTVFLFVVVSIVSANDNPNADYDVAMALPQASFFDLHNGRQKGKMIQPVLRIEKLWWDDACVLIVSEPNPQKAHQDPLDVESKKIPARFEHFVGIGSGLGYKDFQLAKTDNSETEKFLVIVKIKGFFTLKHSSLGVEDEVRWRFLSRYTPLEKIESHRFELNYDYRLPKFMASVQYGLINLRPYYDVHRPSILAYRQIRIGVPLTDRVIAGWQSASQRYQSDVKVWRLRHWLGFYLVFDHPPLKLDLSYGYGSLEKATWELVKNDSHQIALKIILKGDG